MRALKGELCQAEKRRLGGPMDESAKEESPLNLLPLPLVTVFLDFDGVLHPLGAPTERLFERADVLELTLKELPNVEVVVSSTWAAYHSLAHIREFLEVWPTLYERVVGVTAQCRQLPSHYPEVPSRETQCRDWLIANKRSLLHWCAIDDERLNFLTHERVIYTNSKKGFTACDAHRLRELIHTLRLG
ncbi:MAG: hypothetical protein KF871_02085 [Hydrogenophaga sp.]|nr:hypothetical protein [Hydrogenophaga sp.]